jgi:23S rRNA pseudouridine2605 synthase
MSSIASRPPNTEAREPESQEPTLSPQGASEPPAQGASQPGEGPSGNPEGGAPRKQLRTPFRRRKGSGPRPAQDASEGGRGEGRRAAQEPVPMADLASEADADASVPAGDDSLPAFVAPSQQFKKKLIQRHIENDAIAPKLHKVLADSGCGSRREMEELITAGRVSVNGVPAHIGQRVMPTDQVRVNGKLVLRKNPARPPRVLLYHKPAGEIVSHDDPGERNTVFERLPKVKNSKWLAVGRLDFNTEGLLIFTTSGDLANKMSHPRYGVEREYAVRVLGELTSEQRQALLAGVQLEDGLAAFATCDFAGGEGANQWYRVTLAEGRNREVRRMFEAVGLTVSRLIRTRFGEIALPRNLRRGRWEELEAQVVMALMIQVGVTRISEAPSRERSGKRPEGRSEGGRPERNGNSGGNNAGNSSNAGHGNRGRRGGTGTGNAFGGGGGGGGGGNVRPNKAMPDTPPPVDDENEMDDEWQPKAPNAHQSRLSALGHPPGAGVKAGGGYRGKRPRFGGR